MKTTLLGGFLVFGIVGLTAAQQQRAESGLLSVLKKDQRIGLKDLGNDYQISVMPGIELLYKVKEVGADFVVVEDFPGIVETRIPIYRIKSVTITRALKFQEKP
jgi:hypothetical protein